MTPATEVPRLLVVMGSGETSPTMVTTHKRLVERLGPPPVPAVVLDTPFGFQANADVLTRRALDYFRESVGVEMEAARWRTAAEGSAPDGARSLARLHQARYVFAGPGSPSYALRQWSGTAVPTTLAAKLDQGGCVTFASAAALTLGAFTVPVYEIYKSGEELRWLDGLDLLARAGLPDVAVIPHYDNAEGGNHDTRYCYLGEPRLAAMEEQLPAGGVVLGVDEHTGLVLDLGAGTATVVGRGGVTVRRRGSSRVHPAGATVALGDLCGPASPGAAGPSVPAPAAAAGFAGGTTNGARKEEATAPTSLLAASRLLEERFALAVADRDVDAAVTAVLDLDVAIVSWSRDTLQSDQADLARAALRSMVVRLGELAQAGARDPAEVVRPFVDAVLEARDAARAARDWAAADLLRDRLSAAGVEISDAPEGTGWRLLS